MHIGQCNSGAGTTKRRNSSILNSIQLEVVAVKYNSSAPNTHNLPKRYSAFSRFCCTRFTAGISQLLAKLSESRANYKTHWGENRNIFHYRRSPARPVGKGGNFVNFKIITPLAEECNERADWKSLGPIANCNTMKIPTQFGELVGEYSQIRLSNLRLFFSSQHFTTNSLFNWIKRVGGPKIVVRTAFSFQSE